MDITDIGWLFSFLPEKLRPWLSLLVVIVWIITKIRSMSKSQVIAALTGLVTPTTDTTAETHDVLTKGIARKSRLSRLADLLF